MRTNGTRIRDYDDAGATSQVVRYVYDGNVVIQERDHYNVAQITYNQGRDLSGSFESAEGIAGLLALSQFATLTPQHFYYHANAHGNVTALLSTNQQIAARYIYDPFGNTLTASGPMADVNLYRFSFKGAARCVGLGLLSLQVLQQSEFTEVAKQGPHWGAWWSQSLQMRIQ